MKAISLVASSTFAILVAASLSSCAASPEQQRSDALTRYVEAERETIPALLAAFPELYSSVEISGQVGDDLAGVAVVNFTYTYLNIVEFEQGWMQPSWIAARPSWARPLVPQAELEAGKAQLKTQCELTIFPAMREAGITGPMRVEYVYLQPTSAVSWDVTCESVA